MPLEYDHHGRGCAMTPSGRLGRAWHTNPATLECKAAVVLRTYRAALYQSSRQMPLVGFLPACYTPKVHTRPKVCLKSIRVPLCPRQGQRELHRIPPRCAVRIRMPGRISSLSVSALPLLACAVYFPYILFLSPAHDGEAQQDSLRLAVLLSLNFDFVLPLAFPSVAPMLNPVMEAVFNVTVAFSTLFLGFYGDTPERSSATLSRSRPPINDAEDNYFYVDTSTALILMPFLTNMVFLPYLALRTGMPPQSVPESKEDTGIGKALRQISQSPWLPVYSVAILCASLAYGLAAHPSPGLPVNIGQRISELQRLCKENVLTSSFAVDCAAFTAFQSWLVPDDRARRGWRGRRAYRAEIVCSLVPFFGLAWYLWERARDEAERT